MPTTIPITPEEQIRMIQAFYNLRQEEQQKFQAAWKHLRFLMVLWGLDDLSTDHTLILEEKRHVLRHCSKSIDRVMVWLG